MLYWAHFIPNPIVPVGQTLTVSSCRAWTSYSNACLPNHNGSGCCARRESNEMSHWEGTGHMNFRAELMCTPDTRTPVVRQYQVCSRQFGGSSTSGSSYYLCWPLPCWWSCSLRRARQLTRACRGFPVHRARSWGRYPEAGGGSFGNLPGAGGILGGRAGVSSPKGIPTTISTPARRRVRRRCRCRYRHHRHSRSVQSPRRLLGR